jgi:hypothetical protein
MQQIEKCFAIPQEKAFCVKLDRGWYTDLRVVVPRFQPSLYYLGGS